MGDNIQSYTPTKPTIPYNLINPKTIDLTYVNINDPVNPKGSQATVNNTCGLHGYQNAFSP
jgi:hypothetical protein